MDYISKDWINISDTKQWDSKWASRPYKCESYMFAEQYDRNEIKRKVLESHRMKDTIEKVAYIMIVLIIDVTVLPVHLTEFI